MTRTATADIAVPTYARNRAGFPIVECPRCDGTGFMPYTVYGGVCFLCKGGKHVFPKTKAGQLGAAWVDMCSAATKADTSARINCDTGEITCDLKPGDQVRNTYGLSRDQAAKVEWRTVERVEIGDLDGGSSSWGCWPDGTMRLRFLNLGVTIHYTDGTSERGGHLLSRKLPADLLAQRDAMAAQARALHERTLINRERKAARAAA